MKFLWHSLLGIRSLSLLQFKWLNSLSLALSQCLALWPLKTLSIWPHFEYLNLRQELCTLNFVNLMRHMAWNTFVQDRYSADERERERVRNWEWEAAAWQNISIACWHFINAAHSLIEAAVNLWWWCRHLYLPIPHSHPPPRLRCPLCCYTTAKRSRRRRRRRPPRNEFLFTVSAGQDERPNERQTWPLTGRPGGRTDKTQCESWNVTQKGAANRERKIGRGSGRGRRSRNWQGANYMYNQVKKYESTLINWIH